jgi:hypothetical protein
MLEREIELEPMTLASMPEQWERERVRAPTSARVRRRWRVA